MRVLVGDGGVATDTWGLVVGTNVPTYVVIGTTLHVVVTDDLTLSIGDVGWTVFGTLVITGL